MRQALAFAADRGALRRLAPAIASSGRSCVVPQRAVHPVRGRRSCKWRPPSQQIHLAPSSPIIRSEPADIARPMRQTMPLAPRDRRAPGHITRRKPESSNAGRASSHRWGGWGVGFTRGSGWPFGFTRGSGWGVGSTRGSGWPLTPGGKLPFGPASVEQSAASSPRATAQPRTRIPRIMTMILLRMDAEKRVCGGSYWRSTPRSLYRWPGLRSLLVKTARTRRINPN
jgi:hypothetical protein